MAAPRSLEPRDKPALVLDEDDLGRLLNLVERAAKKWREIGACLNFEDRILNKIEASIANGEAVACFTELLTRWLKHAPPKFSLPTLDALLEALRDDDVGEHRIAYKTEERFKKDYPGAAQEADFTAPVPSPSHSQEAQESSTTPHAAEPHLPSIPTPPAATGTPPASTTSQPPLSAQHSPGATASAPPAASQPSLIPQPSMESHPTLEGSSSLSGTLPASTTSQPPLSSQHSPGATASATPISLKDLVNALTRVSNKWFELGIQFGFLKNDLDGIRQERPYGGVTQWLTDMLDKKMNRSPEFGWSDVIQAVVNIGERAVAESIQREHCPQALTSSQLSPSVQSTSGASVTGQPLLFPEENEVKGKIEEFENRFTNLRESTCKHLQSRKIDVKLIVERLTGLKAAEMPDHEAFFSENMDHLFKANGIFELFGKMNMYWNYLSYNLLAHLIKVFGIVEVEGKMEKYKIDLQQFLDDTPINVFCKAQEKKRMVKPPDGFEEMVVKFEWPENITVSIVEEFRQQYAHTYNLYKCSLLVNQIKNGSFIVAWFIPCSVVDRLSREVDEKLLAQFAVSSLEIGRRSVYLNPKPDEMDMTSLSPHFPSTGSTAGSGPQPIPHAGMQTEVDPSLEIDFVKKHSHDVYCPVTFGVLLHPHQTICCGRHLSKEAADRIRGEGGACPLCKEVNWSTILDKYIQRIFQKLQVYCPYKKRGCRWEGELRTLHRHEQFCVCKTSPLETDTQLLLQSRRMKDAPADMERGSAVTHGNTIYYISRHSFAIYCYNADQDKWKKHSTCQYRFTALAIINGYLTTVGGRNTEDQTTNKVLSWKGESWEPEVPPMKTPRYRHAVVSNKHTVVVAGGREESSVEIFTGSHWSSVAPLPDCLSYITATLCRDLVYVMDTDNNIYTSLATLLSTQSTETTATHSTWRRLNKAPVTFSTLSTLNFMVVAVGGLTRDPLAPTADVYRYFPVNDQWVKIGSMQTVRELPIVTVFNSDKMIVVGSDLTYTSSSANTVELLFY